MLRRALAVLAGFTVCQLSMLICLVVGTLLLLAVRGAGLVAQIAALVAVVVLLMLPGLAGGALAGFLGQRQGWLHGALAAGLFALSILAAQLVAVPLLGGQYAILQAPVVLVSAVTTLLAITGAVGGFVGQRRYVVVRARAQARIYRAAEGRVVETAG